MGTEEFRNSKKSGEALGIPEIKPHGFCLERPESGTLLGYESSLHS